VVAVEPRGREHDVDAAGCNGRHIREAPARGAAARRSRSNRDTRGAPSHPALGVRVGVRRLDRRADYTRTARAEDIVEGGAELRVPVVDEEAHRSLALGEVDREIARLLGDPHAARVACAASEVDASASKLDERAGLEVEIALPRDSAGSRSCAPRSWLYRSRSDMGPLR
jgi:hypothetical protein